MKKLAIYLSMFAFSLVVLASCSDDDSTTSPTTITVNTPTAIDSVHAASVEDTTVMLSWKASASQSDADFYGYDVSISPGAYQTIHVGKFASTWGAIKIPYNLNPEIEYTFTITAVNKKDTVVKTSTPVTFKWATARYLEFDAYNEPIKLYDKASQNGSGINFYFGNDKPAPTVMKVTSYSDWQFGAYFTDDKEIIIGNPGSLGFNNSANATWTTEFCSDYYGTDKFSETMMNTPLSSLTFDAKTFDLAKFTDNSFTLIARTYKTGTTDYHYMKIAFTKTGTSWLATDVAGSYITCKVSYQSKTNLPYAK